jgi:hypothetical protein
LLADVGEVFLPLAPREPVDAEVRPALMVAIIVIIIFICGVFIFGATVIMREIFKRSLTPFTRKMPFWDLREVLQGVGMALVAVFDKRLWQLIVFNKRLWQLIVFNNLLAVLSGRRVLSDRKVVRRRRIIRRWRENRSGCLLRLYCEPHLIQHGGSVCVAVKLRPPLA